MTPSNIRTALLLALVLQSAYACSSVARYPHAEVLPGQKIGVYAIDESGQVANNENEDLITVASRNATEDIQQRLFSLAVDKTVLKYFMQSFPARTRANVVPILDSQVKSNQDSVIAIDSLATGKNLSLDYVMLLKLKRQLNTTGYHYQEQWRPRLLITAELIRVTDGRILMREIADASETPFDKFQDRSTLSKFLKASYSSLAAKTVNQLSEKVGPVVRQVPESEKRVHRKIYNFGHIRSMASKDNCVISGELIMQKTEKLVTYQVPCRDITLTYACDNESESSYCWLQ